MSFLKQGLTEKWGVNEVRQDENGCFVTHQLKGGQCLFQTVFSLQCIQKNKNLKRLLEMLIVKKRERLFVNKRGDEDAELSEAREAREKKGQGRPFKLFDLMFPQTDARGGQRSPRGGQVVKNKGWMLEKVQEALKDWQEGVGEWGNSRKMLMEKLAANQRMMPIPRIG